MRLIDADKLENDLMDIAHNEFVPDEYRQFCFGFAERVTKEPTIEAEPVRHGRWVEDDDGETVCSECNGVSPNGWYWKHCPHCAAKMDGDEGYE